MTSTLPGTDAETWRLNLRGEVLDGAGPDGWWWTGAAPQACAGFQADGTLTSLPLPDLTTFTRDQVRDYFQNSWALTETLLSGLAEEESFFRPPFHGLRHPMAFYYCHPAVLYVNKLRVAGLLDKGVDPYFEQLFETGVDEMRWDDMSKNEIEWPTLRAIHDYRVQTYALVLGVIDNHPGLAEGHGPVTMDDPLWALFMGFEHERIHLETSSVLMRELPLDLLRRPAAWRANHPTSTRPATSSGSAAALELADITGGPVTVGKPRLWPSYGWDNEYGSRTVTLEPFRVGTTLVSNAQFHEFLVAGGYREEKYWTAGGWAWRTFRNTKFPAFWVQDGPAGLNQFRLRLLFDEVDMQGDWPAEVNGHEAHAYAAWRSEQDDTTYRVPSEAEMRRLRGPGLVDPVQSASGADFAEQHINLQLAFSSSSPVTWGTPTDDGVFDVNGNVWQWCADDFNPLPGGRVHPYYDDFSSPCYDGQHQMILGGSWASTGDEASTFARFHFRSHFMQHVGFRLVEATHDGGAIELAAGESVYEDPDTVAQYLLLHYGSSEEQMPHAFGPVAATRFAQRTAHWINEAAAELGAPTGRALDVGCAVGGAALELAKAYDEVIGCDLSEAFVNAAAEITAAGSLDYSVRSQGDRRQHLTAVVDPAIDRTRVTFRQADACSLPPEYVGFDAVLLANLLCRLPSPKSLIGRLGGPRGLVREGGLLAIFSPYTWMEQFTPREAWIGGTDEAESAEVLKALLTENGFRLVREDSEPLVIRETERKYQYVVSHATLWQRVF